MGLAFQGWTLPRRECRLQGMEGLGWITVEDDEWVAGVGGRGLAGTVSKGERGACNTKVVRVSSYIR